MDMSINVAPSPNPRKKGARRDVAACLHTLYPLLATHNAMSADGGRRVSDATRRERAEFAIRTVRLLHEMGYPLKDIHHLKPKHIGAIVRSWESRGFSAAAMQKYLAFLGTICRWIGKPAIVGKLPDHLVDPARGKRCRHAIKDMSWSARTDTWAKIAEIMANLTNPQRRDLVSSKVSGLMPTREDLKRATPSILRGTALGGLHDLFQPTGVLYELAGAVRPGAGRFQESA